MARLTSNQTVGWILTNRKCLASAAVAAAGGVLIGIFIEGGPLMPLAGSIIGALLGVTGGVFGGLLIQEQRRLDDIRPDANALWIAMNSISTWVDYFEASKEDLLKDFAIDQLLAKLEGEIATLEKPAPRMGIEVEEARRRLWTECVALLAKRDHPRRDAGVMRVALALDQLRLHLRPFFPTA